MILIPTLVGIVYIISQNFCFVKAPKERNKKMPRYYKSEYENGNIPTKWKTVCMVEIEHPEYTQEQAAAEAGISRKALYNLHHDSRYMDFYHKECEKVFNSLESLAIKTMRRAAERGNINAAKYILDYKGFKAPETVDINSGEVEINIVKNDKD